MGKPNKLNRPLYVKDHYIIEKCMAVWDDFSAPGVPEEREVYSQKYGPFNTPEEAEEKKKELRNLRNKEIKEDRQEVCNKFGVSKATLYHSSLERDFSPGDFYFDYSEHTRFRKISLESIL